MNKRRGASGFGMGGYTITEVMIVLAATTVLFAAVAISFSGRQASTEFTQAVRAYEAQLQNTISEVTTGNYLMGQCDGRGATISLTTNHPGSCIFLGKVYTGYDDTSNATSANIRTLVGKRLDASGQEVTDLTASGANPVYASAADQTYNHSFRLQVRRVVRLDTSAVLSGFGFLLPLAGSAAIGGDQSAGSRQTSLYGLSGGSSPSNLVVMTSGIMICLQGQNNQRAEITVGASASQSLLFSTLDTANTGVCQNA